MKIETFAIDDLGPTLAARVAGDLRAAISSKGRASLAVPGGSTPGPFLSALAAEKLDWEKVTVTLTDERCVPADHDRSNEGLVRRHLFRGDAKAATFISLWAEDREIAAIESDLNDRGLPLDVCVLGMGDDMHTASLFPGTPGLASLLDRNENRSLALVAPPGADEPRITLTATALASAESTYLLIKGAGKRDALMRALATKDLEAAPIRAILDAARSPVVFHAD